MASVDGASLFVGIARDRQQAGGALIAGMGSCSKNLQLPT